MTQDSSVTPNLPVRDIARALVFDPDDRLLLIAYEAVRPIDPAAPEPGHALRAWAALPLFLFALLVLQGRTVVPFLYFQF